MCPVLLDHLSSTNCHTSQIIRFTSKQLPTAKATKSVLGVSSDMKQKDCEILIDYQINESGLHSLDNDANVAELKEIEKLKMSL